MNKKIKVGSICQLYPGDTYKKVGKVLSISEIGWEFEMVEGTSSSSEYSKGDIIFFSHSKSLTLKLIK